MSSSRPTVRVVRLCRVSCGSDVRCRTENASRRTRSERLGAAVSDRAHDLGTGVYEVRAIAGVVPLRSRSPPAQSAPLRVDLVRIETTDLAGLHGKCTERVRLPTAQARDLPAAHVLRE